MFGKGISLSAALEKSGPCAVWELGGDTLSEDLSQVWWKIKRAEILWIIILLLRLAPAERNIFFHVVSDAVEI